MSYPNPARLTWSHSCRAITTALAPSVGTIFWGQTVLFDPFLFLHTAQNIKKYLTQPKKKKNPPLKCSGSENEPPLELRLCVCSSFIPLIPGLKAMSIHALARHYHVLFRAGRATQTCHCSTIPFFLCLHAALNSWSTVWGCVTTCPKGIKHRKAC